MISKILYLYLYNSFIICSCISISKIVYPINYLQLSYCSEKIGDNLHNSYILFEKLSSMSVCIPDKYIFSYKFEIILGDLPLIKYF